MPGSSARAFDPYRINSDPNLARLLPRRPRPACLELSAERLRGRRALLGQIDPGRRPFGLDEFQARAFDLLASTAARRAFDISRRTRRAPATATAGTPSASRPCWPGGWSRPGVRLVHVNWVRHDNGKGGSGLRHPRQPPGPGQG